MVDARVRTVCEMMAAAIKMIEKEITAKEDRVEKLWERVRKLEAEAKPDLPQIEELKNDIRDLEAELENDRPQLAAFQEEFNAECAS